MSKAETGRQSKEWCKEVTQIGVRTLFDALVPAARGLLKFKDMETVSVKYNGDWVILHSPVAARFGLKEGVIIKTETQLLQILEANAQYRQNELLSKKFKP